MFSRAQISRTINKKDFTVQRWTINYETVFLNETVNGTVFLNKSSYLCIRCGPLLSSLLANLHVIYRKIKCIFILVTQFAKMSTETCAQLGTNSSSYCVCVHFIFHRPHSMDGMNSQSHCSKLLKFMYMTSNKVNSIKLMQCIVIYMLFFLVSAPKMWHHVSYLRRFEQINTKTSTSNVKSRLE